MSGKTIRTSSDAARKPTQTDWARLKTISDDEIDAAIAGDADAYPLDIETLGRSGSAYRYEVYKAAESCFRWRLVSADGRVLASSDDGFATRAAAREAIAGVRAALLGGRPLAA